ncbi:MAG: hypothetical protein IKP40_13530 [Clostridia bacterium]|nr:hypothetical protein [Clostridia bacterium]
MDALYRLAKVCELMPMAGGRCITCEVCGKVVNVSRYERWGYGVGSRDCCSYKCQRRLEMEISEEKAGKCAFDGHEDEIMARLEAGESKVEVARSYGRIDSALHVWLKKRGITLGKSASEAEDEPAEAVPVADRAEAFMALGVIEAVVRLKLEDDGAEMALEALDVLKVALR